MLIFKRLRRHVQRPQRAALSALLALCIGWTLALAHAAQQSAGRVELDDHDTTCVRITAELRVGEPAPAPAANVADAQASLRALHARVRFCPQLPPLAAARLASAPPLRARARARSTSGDGPESASHRVIARRWPLPRSSCSDSDPDADAARQS